MNDKFDIWRLTLSREEIYYLCCLLQVTGLIGLEDPFLGLFTEEVDERIATARDSLTQRGCLTRQKDGSLAIGAGVVGIMAAVTLADDAVVATLSVAGQQPVIRFLHIRPDALVEQETLPNREVALAVVPKREMLAQRLLDVANPPVSEPAPGSAFTISASNLEAARKLARQTSSDDCRHVLERAGVPKEAALSLSSCLAIGERHGSVTLLHRSSTAIHYGESLAWLVGPDGAWQVTSLDGNGQQAVHLVPRASTQIAQGITRFASHVIEGTISMR